MNQKIMQSKLSVRILPVSFECSNLSMQLFQWAHLSHLYVFRNFISDRPKFENRETVKYVYAWSCTTENCQID